MSVEQKIRDLLAGKTAGKIEEAAQMGADSVKKDASIKTAVSGDATQPKQGGSQVPAVEVRDETDDNQGAQTAKGIKPNNLQARGAGQAPNFTTVGDPTSVVNQPNSKGNVAQEEVEEDEVEEIVVEDEQEEFDVKSELNAIFGNDLTEDFRTKATSIFEAAVIARVNSEMDKISEQLQEQHNAEVEQIKESLVEKIDSFLNYVVEKWMEENELAVERGLRAEITEDFIQGLQVLFKEHYIEVPEEKYEVIDDLQTKVNKLEGELEESASRTRELEESVRFLKKETILSEMTTDLADTEVEKLCTLIEGVSYDSEELFREKVKVIKENYFPKSIKAASEETVLTEEAPAGDAPEAIQRYAQALSRSAKSR
jgi:hypothetical protein